MQKILSKSQRERKVKRNQLIVGIVLVGLMLLSTAGYAFMDRTDSSSTNQNAINYKGIVFTRTSEYWNFQLNNLDFTTLYNPEEVKDINPLVYLSLQDYSGKPIYYVTEPSDAESEFARNLDTRIVLRMQKACIPDVNCTDPNLPMKNCSVDNLIVIKEPSKNEDEKVYQENKCIFIVSKYSNQTRYADAVLYKILGV